MKPTKTHTELKVQCFTYCVESSKGALTVDGPRRYTITAAIWKTVLEHHQEVSIFVAMESLEALPTGPNAFHIFVVSIALLTAT
jgi:hypothetical protein